NFLHGVGSSTLSHQLTVMYHWLDLDRSRGVYDADRFERYLKIPHWSSYVNNAWMVSLPLIFLPDGLQKNRTPYGNHGTAVGELDAISDDTPLVKDYLERLLAHSNSYVLLNYWAHTAYTAQQ